MLISEFFAKYSDRIIPIFAEEKSYSKKSGAMGLEIFRSSFAIMYDTFTHTYRISTWSGSGAVAAYGISEQNIIDNLVVIKTAADFDKVLVPDDGITHRWVGMFKNFIGEESIEVAFNRLVKPLRELEKFQLNGEIVAEKKKNQYGFTFFGRYLKPEWRKQKNGFTFSLDCGKMTTKSTRQEVNLTGFPSLLNIHKTLNLTFSTQSSFDNYLNYMNWNAPINQRVSYTIVGNGNLVLQFNEPSVLYYMYLLKEQHKMQSTWSYKIKKLFGKVPKSKGFVKQKDASDQPKSSSPIDDLRDLPFSALLPERKK